MLLNKWRTREKKEKNRGRCMKNAIDGQYERFVVFEWGNGNGTISFLVSFFFHWNSSTRLPNESTIGNVWETKNETIERIMTSYTTRTCHRTFILIFYLVMSLNCWFARVFCHWLERDFHWLLSEFVHCISNAYGCFHLETSNMTVNAAEWIPHSCNECIHVDPIKVSMECFSRTIVERPTDFI
jgi:hypothetical protein